MKQVEIPGGVATVRETEDLRGRDRQLIRAASLAAGAVLDKMIAARGNGPEPEDEEAKKAREEAFAATAQEIASDSSLSWQEWLRFLEFRQAVVIAQLAAWSLPDPLPTMTTIGDLPPDLFDALDAAVGGVPASAAETDFSPTATAEVDPEVPTGGSSSSAGPDKDEASSLPTPELSSDSAPTSTVGSSQP